MKLITIPLHDFLDYIWHGRDRACIDLELAQQIAAIDTDNELCHIEYPDDKEHSELPRQNMPILWRKIDWNISHTKWLQLKAISEEYNAQLFAYKQKIAELEEGIRKTFGNAMAPEMVTNMATSIYNLNNLSMAAQLGVAGPLKQIMEKPPVKV
jgi:hypothetical protein